MKPVAMPPGELFDIGGRRLHAVIAGELKKQPPVVLEAGLTAMSACWHWVQDELAKTTRVLAYDRAGLGWSDASDQPRDSKNVALDLQRLLDAAKFPRPFIYVGHSLGGIFGRVYASMFPSEIAGLALVDAAHPDQLERSPKIKWAMRRLFCYLRAAPHLAATGATKVVGDFGISEKAAHGLPAIHKLATKEFFASPRHMHASYLEAAAWDASMQQARAAPLGDLPLLTVTAPEHCMTGWMALQAELATLTPRARHVILPGASHITVLTNEEYATRVAREVADLVPFGKTHRVA